MGLFGKSSSRRTVVEPENPPADVDELSLIIAGAPDNSARVAATKKFIASNRRHSYADGVCGVAAYVFSGLMHVRGQSTALTLLSMWAAGTTFFVNVAMRRVLTEASLASLESDGSSLCDDGATGTRTKEVSTEVTTVSSRSETGAAGRSRQAESARRELRHMAATADFETQVRKVFQMEAVGSWIWVLASLQQFRIHKRLQWCGYSSWMGLSCAMYYTLRHAYNVLVA